MSPVLIGIGLVGALAILVGVLIAISHRRKRARAASFEHLALSMGLAYQRKADKDFRNAWATLPQIPRKGDIQHLMFGEHEGVPITLFRHRYVVSTGQTTAVIVHWVFSAEAPDWPEIHLKRRSRLARALGRASRVTNDPDFNSAWIIKSEDDAFARTLLSAPLRQFLMTPPVEKHLARASWHIVGGKLCAVLRANLTASLVETQIHRLHEAQAAIAKRDPANRGQLIGSEQ